MKVLKRKRQVEQPAGGALGDEVAHPGDRQRVAGKQPVDDPPSSAGTQPQPHRLEGGRPVAEQGEAVERLGAAAQHHTSKANPALRGGQVGEVDAALRQAEGDERQAKGPAEPAGEDEVGRPHRKRAATWADLIDCT